MTLQPPTADLAAVLRRALRPPVREMRFWVIQAMVVLIAGIHLLVDLQVSISVGAFPAGIPVALLIVPVGYAAIRYGLAGSAATGIWATLLWLPDLLLPHDQGHVGGDLFDLALVVVIAIAFGQRIEAERLAHAGVEAATAAALAVEVRYRRLFETNRSPILVLDQEGRVSDANPSARSLFGPDVVGCPSAELLAGAVLGERPPGRVLTLHDGRDYRLERVPIPAASGEPCLQVTLEDVTEERSEGRRATRYAQLVVQAEEEQRLRLSRELHDEPLQLFLHLARRLESLAGVSGVPEPVVGGLDEARRQALDAAARLRTLARDLRPPALDQLGLVAALSSLLADVQDETGVDAELRVEGTEVRLSPEAELGAFRIVQEAVRNTLRHAGSRRVALCVRFTEDALDLQVKDDGRGFRPSEFAEAGASHLGILGMRERARLLGGTLEIESAPGRGTVVEATLPVTLSAAGRPCLPAMVPGAGGVRPLEPPAHEGTVDPSAGPLPSLP